MKNQLVDEEGRAPFFRDRAGSVMFSIVSSLLEAWDLKYYLSTRVWFQFPFFQIAHWFNRVEVAVLNSETILDISLNRKVSFDFNRGFHFISIEVVEWLWSDK